MRVKSAPISSYLVSRVVAFDFRTQVKGPKLN